VSGCPSRTADDGAQALGTLAPGRSLVMLNRGDDWQCAYVIQKVGWERLEQQGLPALRESLVALAPFLVNGRAVGPLGRNKLLPVVVDRLERWSAPGVLCIGNAAPCDVADRRRRAPPHDPERDRGGGPARAGAARAPG
jgi:2-polyprenyl-6-methoxyphenol hydroxylase-like FAD-dependent oxidoreductase